jgi:hypothetical protein
VELQIQQRIQLARNRKSLTTPPEPCHPRS